MRRTSRPELGTLSGFITTVSPHLTPTDETGLDAPFSGVMFLEAEMQADSGVRGQIVLAPGLGQAEFESTARALAEVGAAALVVRATQFAASVEIPLLLLDQTGDWGQVYAAAQALTRPRVSEYVASAKLGDLFGAANSLASIAFGAVSFVDDGGQIIAYSTHADQPLDDVRRASTLSLREEAPISTDADYREVMRSSTSLHFLGHNGQFGRVARTIRYAGEVLGTVWIVQVDPAGAPATMELLDSVAPIITQHLLRARNDELEGGHRRRQLVHAILEDTADAPTAYAQLALPPNQDMTVVSFGVRDDSAAHTRFGLRRLLNLVKGNASTAFAFYECALLENRVIIVIAGGTIEHIASFARWVCRTDETIAAGIGSQAPGHPNVPKSYREAELVVSTLLASNVSVAGDAHPRAARFDALRDTIALRQITDMLAKLTINAGDTFDRLVEHDQAHGTELVTTVRTYLDSGGSVRDAATSLHVHQNTLRYRLATVSDALGIDLSNPHTRLWLWLRLTEATFASS